MIELSKRMQTVANMVPPGSAAADIGCDHGFVSIYLVQQKICPAVYAADVRPGPLSRAKEHIAQAGLESYITPLLSDGLKEVPVGTDSAKSGMPGADGILAAGMGGRLTVRILTDVPEKTKKLSWAVLEPQSDVNVVRRFLWENGFVIDEEAMVYEDGKYYPVMRAENRELFGNTAAIKSALDKHFAVQSLLKENGFTEEEIQQACDWLGGLLILQKNAVLKDFLNHTIRKDREVLDEMPQIAVCGEKSEKDIRIARRRGEIRQRIELAGRILEFMR